MSFASDHNIDAYIAPVNASDSGSATAGGTGDATAVNGIIIDRDAHGHALSACFATRYKTTLAQTKTLTLAYSLKHGDDSGLSDVSEFASGSVVVATGPTGGATVRDILRTAIDLAGAKRYIRFDVTPDLSASGTDTAEFSTVAVFGGLYKLPV